jgi:hypothetical protein
VPRNSTLLSEMNIAAGALVSTLSISSSLCYKIIRFQKPSHSDKFYHPWFKCAKMKMVPWYENLICGRGIAQNKLLEYPRAAFQRLRLNCCPQQDPRGEWDAGRKRQGRGGASHSITR